MAGAKIDENLKKELFDFAQTLLKDKEKSTNLVDHVVALAGDEKYFQLMTGYLKTKLAKEGVRGVSIEKRFEGALGSNDVFKEVPKEVKDYWAKLPDTKQTPKVSNPQAVQTGLGNSDTLEKKSEQVEKKSEKNADGSFKKIVLALGAGATTLVAFASAAIGYYYYG